MNHIEVNMASIILTKFARVRRGGDLARLALGTHTTRIARNQGDTDVYKERLLTYGPRRKEFGLDELLRADMICVDEPLSWEAVKHGMQEPPPAGTPAADAM
ncbi:hypothetical protein Hanom_Chr03g00190211 [Helianthus anomalus]